MRELRLYDCRMSGMTISCQLVASESPLGSNLVQQAYDMARDYGVDDGHVSIVDDGVCVEKIDISKQ